MPRRLKTAASWLIPTRGPHFLLHLRSVCERAQIWAARRRRWGRGTGRLGSTGPKGTRVIHAAAAARKRRKTTIQTGQQREVWRGIRVVVGRVTARGRAGSDGRVVWKK